MSIRLPGRLAQSLEPAGCTGLGDGDRRQLIVADEVAIARCFARMLSAKKQYPLRLH